MKKFLGMIGLLCLTYTLAACGNSVTSEDLQQHKWEVDAQENTEEMIMVADFDEKKMTMSFDASAMETNASDEWEQLGEEFGKNLLESMKFTFEYTLDKNELKLTSLDSNQIDIDNTYLVKKDGENILLKSKDEDKGAELLLKPYTKSDQK